MISLESLGRRFACTAIPYPWPHGIGVHIEVTTEGEPVASVHVLSVRDSAEFAALVPLSTPDLCALALQRFSEGKLSVTLQSALCWQEAISAMGYNYVSPLISSFSLQDEHATPKA